MPDEHPETLRKSARRYANFTKPDRRELIAFVG
jgi:hypothetical protein